MKLDPSRIFCRQGCGSGAGPSSICVRSRGLPLHPSAKLGPVKDYFHDDAQRMIARMVEVRSELLRVSDRADLLHGFQEAAGLVHDWVTQFELAQTAFLDAGRLSHYTAVESALRRDTLSLASSLENEFKGRKLQLDAFEALHRPAIDTALASVLRYQEELKELTATIKQSYEYIAAPAKQIQFALATLEASARLYLAPEAHWSNALAVVASYERFAIRQTKKSASDSRVVAARRARVTELAGALLTSSLGATEAMGSEPPLVAPTITLVKPRIFGPLNSHLGFVYRATVEVDVELAVAGALPARLCHLGGAIVAIVVRINESLRRCGEDDVFRPTNRSLCAASVISAVVAGTERDFADVIDALFFLLYEGSGGSSSRLSSLLSDEDLQPLWRLKNFRLNYRHDIEHGDNREIAKKHQKIGAAFVAIVGKSIPARPAEWTSAQAELYKQLFDMLTKAEEAAQISGSAA
jgi:hypothetical protein